MPPVTQLPLATVAASEFRKRQQRAQDVVRNRGMSRGQAEQHLRPWLAIAVLCGADLQDVADLVADRREDVGLAEAAEEQRPLREAEARWLVAEEICPRPRWVPILAAARDDAFNRYLADSQNPALTTAAATLQRIALHLRYDVNGCHVPPYRAPAPVSPVGAQDAPEIVGRAA